MAPASSSTVGPEPGTGIGVAIAGRLTPLMRPMRSNAAAIVAPVLPAEIIALGRSVAYGLGGADEGRVLLPPHALGGVVVHLDDLAGGDQRQPSDVDPVAEVGRTDEGDRRAGRRGGSSPRDDRVGCMVAAHGVDGDGEHRMGGRGQATSTATRFLYQPQVGHTLCGVFAFPQRGQRLRAGASSRQAPARRLRVFDFDFFFFGTATVGSLVRSGRNTIAAENPELSASDEPTGRLKQTVSRGKRSGRPGPVVQK